MDHAASNLRREQASQLAQTAAHLQPGLLLLRRVSMEHRRDDLLQQRLERLALLSQGLERLLFPLRPPRQLLLVGFGPLVVAGPSFDRQTRPVKAPGKSRSPKPSASTPNMFRNVVYSLLCGSPCG